MSSYKPIDSKREEFRKYLERTGVMDALTKALVALYEEPDKPEDAMGYIRSYLGGGNSGIGDETFKMAGKSVADESKMNKEKSENLSKGAGDNSSGPNKTNEHVQNDGERKSVGAGDAPSAATKDSVVGRGNVDVTGKHIAESMPTEAVA